MDVHPAGVCRRRRSGTVDIDHDEVLAVGDANFQKNASVRWRCRRKRRAHGLFVSHNMGMITIVMFQLSTRIRKGYQAGTPMPMSYEYYTKGHSSPAYVDFTKSRNGRRDYAELLRCSVKNSQGAIATEVDIREPITVAMRFRILKSRSVHHFTTFLFLFRFCLREPYSALCLQNSELRQLEPG